ncbi:NAD(P)-binding protein [Stipitochalara longipes BDJ]|nr:NAD(P)-binding protein [Stipitochalara longipes BDJ]
MAPKKENLLLIGATGYIGSYILEEIIKAKESFGKIAIFTSPKTAETKAEKLEKLKSQGVEVIIGDTGNEGELLKAFEGIDTVISAAGRPIIAQQIDWINAAIKAPSVKRFFPSEYGTDVEYDESSKGEVPHQQKLKVRAALRQQEKEGKGLEYTLVVTGPFAYGFLAAGKAGLGGFDVKEKKAVVLGDGKGRVSLTTDPDVGKLVVAALLHPEAAKNRALRVNSFTTTPLDIVKEFEKQTGGEKWEVEYVSFEKIREEEKKAYEESNPWAVGFTLRRIWGEGGTLYEKRDNWVVEKEEGLDSLEDAVKVAIAAQTKGSHL